MEDVKRTQGRSYGQFCGLARALDVVGDRWNFLIVRELLPGPMRYKELRSSLGGIATNLLASRLRDLESNGIVERRVADPGMRYALTPWGAELREPMEALGRWGTPLVMKGRGDDAFQPRWLVLALPALLRGVISTPAVEVGFDVEGFLIALRVDEEGPHASANPDHRPETILAADAETVVAFVAGGLTAEQAASMGQLHGSLAALQLITVRPPLHDSRVS